MPPAGGSEPVEAIKGLRQRRLHKAFLRDHDPENCPVLREALKGMGRADLIGPRPDQSVPAHQPAGTGTVKAAAPRSLARRMGGGQRFTTKGLPLKK